MFCSARRGGGLVLNPGCLWPQVYYDLLAEREKRGITDVALARVEQLSPFPFDCVKRHAEVSGACGAGGRGGAVEGSLAHGGLHRAVQQDFPNAEIVWCQEEPKNMGGWSYVAPRIRTALREAGLAERVTYTGRAPAAATATGNKKDHIAEQEKLVDEALSL